MVRSNKVRFYRLLGLFAFVLAALSHSLLAKEEEADVWYADLFTVQGRLVFFQAVLERHPNLVTRSMPFKRNFLELSENVATSLHLINGDPSALEVSAGDRLSAEFAPGAELEYDETRLSEFKNALKDDVRALGNVRQQAMLDVLVSGRSSSLKPLLRLLPFVFDINGMNSVGVELTNDRFQGILFERIDAARGGDIDQAYHDLYALHLKPLIKKWASKPGRGRIGQILSGFDNQFIKTVVTRALEPRAENHAEDPGTIAKRFVSLEQVSPVVALVRSMFGGDCSGWSVPAYVFVPGVKTYWVRKSRSFRGQPDGYAVVAPVRVNGQVLPYIITINGTSLQQADAAEIVRMVAAHWKSKEVVLPDFRENAELVNFEVVRKGMTIEDAQDAHVDFSAEWKRLSQAGPTSDRYKDYYDERKIRHAKIARVDRTSRLRHEQPVLGYRPVKDIAKSPVLERAILAVQAGANGRDTPEDAKIREILSLTKEQVLAALPLQGRKTDLSVTELKDLQRVLGFSETDFSRMESSLRVHTLSRIGREERDFFSKSEWQRLVTAAHNDLIREMEGLAPDQNGKIGDLLVQRLMLPYVEGAEAAWNEARDVFVSRFRDPVHRDKSLYLLDKITRLHRDPVVNEQMLTMLEDLVENSPLPEVVDPALDAIVVHDNFTGARFFSDRMNKQMTSLLKGRPREPILLGGALRYLPRIREVPTEFWENLYSFFRMRSSETSVSMGLVDFVQSRREEEIPEVGWTEIARAIEYGGKASYERTLSYILPFSSEYWPRFIEGLKRVRQEPGAQSDGPPVLGKSFRTRLGKTMLFGPPEAKIGALEVVGDHSTWLDSLKSEVTQVFSEEIVGKKTTFSAEKKIKWIEAFAHAVEQTKFELPWTIRVLEEASVHFGRSEIAGLSLALLVKHRYRCRLLLEGGANP